MAVSDETAAVAAARSAGLVAIDGVGLAPPAVKRLAFVPNVCLTVAQIVSAIGCSGACVAVAVCAVHCLRKWDELAELGGLRVAWIWLFLAGAVGICYNAALFLVFSFVKEGRRG